ncbi:MAG: GIY-YIG nuclease family protein [Candidatus Saccharimonadales bacterium]
MDWYVYIAEAKSGRYYTGISPRPQKRLAKHNTGKGSRFAMQYGPLKLVFVSKKFRSKEEARKQEVKVKSWSREKKQKLINGEWDLL